MIPTKHHSKTSQPEYRHIIRWVNQNKKHFTWGRGSGNTKYFDLSHSGNEQIYGKIQMNDAGQPEKYYIRCDYLEKELQKLHCSTQILPEWKQEGLLLCDRGSLWCRRVIDPENGGDKAAVYVLAAMDEQLPDVEVETAEEHDADEEPQFLEEAQSDEELFDYSDEDEEEEEPIDIDPNDPEWNPENNPFDDDEDPESEDEPVDQSNASSPSRKKFVFDNNDLDDDLKEFDLELDDDDDDDDSWCEVTDEQAQILEGTSSDNQDDETKTSSDWPEFDDNGLDDDLKEYDLGLDDD